LPDKQNSGRLAIYTDTYCIDDYQMKDNADNCFWMIKSLVKYELVLMLSNLIHGMNIYNDLQIRSKAILASDYDDKAKRLNNTNDNNSIVTYGDDKCIYNNYTMLLNKPENTGIPHFRHHNSQITTAVIPNIIDRYSFEDNKEEKPNFILEYFESLLYTLIPLLTIIFTIILITKCRKIRMKRVRPIVSLAQLKQSTQEYSYNDLNSSIDSSTAIINSIV
jgi:hypothetical protein